MGIKYSGNSGEKSGSSSSGSALSSSDLGEMKGRSYVHRVGSSLTHNGTFADSDFSPVIAPSRQANILIYAKEKMGKTTFCTMYAPEPVRVINFDGRSDEAVFRAREAGRDVEIAKFTLPHRYLPPDQMKVKAREVVEKVMKNYEICIEESLRGNVRSILWDTATEYRNILKYAFDGTLEETKEGAFGVANGFINRQWERIFNLAREAGSAHIIVTARMNEIWETGADGQRKATGKFKPNCPEKILESVDWAGQMKMKSVFGRSEPRFELTITSAGTDSSQYMKTYSQDQWDKLGGPFIYSCVMNYRDSIPSDWE